MGGLGNRGVELDPPTATEAAAAAAAEAAAAAAGAKEPSTITGDPWPPVWQTGTETGTETGPLQGVGGAGQGVGVAGPWRWLPSW